MTILAACILNIQNIPSQKTKKSIRTVEGKTMVAYSTQLDDKESLKSLGNVSVRPSQYESLSGGEEGRMSRNPQSINPTETNVLPTSIRLQRGDGNLSVEARES